MGGGSAMERTSTTQSVSSISPEARLGFSRPARRRVTVPVIRTTYSLRRSTDPSTTHWTMPGAVADVDEGEVLAVLAAGVDPAAHADALVGVVGAQIAAVVATHGGGAGGSHGPRGYR